MSKMLYGEILKLKKKKFLFIIVILQLATFFISCVFNSRFGTEGLTWNEITYYYITLNTFFMMFAYGGIILRVADVEHKSRMWNVLFTAENCKVKLYIAKSIVVLSIILFSTIISGVMIILLGVVLGLGNPEYELIIKSVIFSMIGLIPFLSLQLGLSINNKNGVVPMGAGIVGTFISLFGLYIPFRVLWIWTYPILSMPISLRYINEEISYVSNGECGRFLFLSVVISAVIYGIFLKVYKRREIF